MLRLFLIILYFSNIQSSLIRFNDKSDSYSQRKIPVSKFRKQDNIIELDELDPRNQGVSSSYSIVETSRGPNKVTVTKKDHYYEPQKKHSDVEEYKTAGYKEVKSGNSKKSGNLKKIDDDEPLGPKSINEKVEDILLQPAGSSIGSHTADLKDAGSLLSGSIGGAFDDGYEKEKHYEKEAGKKAVEEHKAEGGQKSSEGYKKQEGYDKAEKDKHAKEFKEAKVSEKEGEKQGHKEQAKEYEKAYKGKEGEKGVSITTKGGHKKGKKTKGFHKVHHKDEYKKDEVFYDESHDGNEHEEHKHESEKHKKEKGGEEKKKHVDSAYHEGHAEKKGKQKKGSEFKEAEGHDKQAGKEVQHKEHSKYGKKAEAKEGKKYSHSEGGKNEGGYHEEDELL